MAQQQEPGTGSSASTSTTQSSDGVHDPVEVAAVGGEEVQRNTDHEVTPEEAGYERLGFENNFEGEVEWIVADEQPNAEEESKPSAQDGFSEEAPFGYNLSRDVPMSKEHVAALEDAISGIKLDMSKAPVWMQRMSDEQWRMKCALMVSSSKSAGSTDRSAER